VKGTAPLGLRVVIAALAEHDWAPQTAAHTADEFHDAPGVILRALHDGLPMNGALCDIIDQRYPEKYGPRDDQPASECADFSMDAAFWTGVATCWHLMTAMNGKDIR
jgi:hypothetical protein